MGGMAKYAAVNTKVKALERNLLDDEEFDRIIESKNYLDAVRYLKMTQRTIMLYQNIT